MSRALKVLAAGLVLAVGVAPVLAAAEAAETQPIAGGYCPVAYVKMHKALKGDPQHA